MTINVKAQLKARKYRPKTLGFRASFLLQFFCFLGEFPLLFKGKLGCGMEVDAYGKYICD